MKRKGTSWLAWILLLLIMVSISISVFTWARSKGESWTESTVEYVTGQLECQEVRIKAIKGVNCEEVNVTNKGRASIAGFNLRYDGESELDTSAILKPYESKILNTAETYGKVEVIPVVEAEGRLFGCKGKKLTVTCP